MTTLRQKSLTFLLFIVFTLNKIRHTFMQKIIVLCTYLTVSKHETKLDYRQLNCLKLLDNLSLLDSVNVEN